MPINTSNLIALTIPTLSGGGGGVGEDGFDVGEVVDGMDSGGISGMRCFINQTMLLGENLASSSLLSRKMKSKDRSLIFRSLDSLFCSLLP